MALGIVLATAGLFHEYRRANAQSEKGKLTTRDRSTFALYIAALTIYVFAFLFSATIHEYFAAFGGIATLVVVFAIRRSYLGPWGISAIMSVDCFVVAAVVILQPDIQKVGLTLAFAPRDPAPLVQATQRILIDSGWTGIGGGTFAAILPIYREIDNLRSDRLRQRQQPRSPLK